MKRRRPWPMFWRVFGAMVLMVVLGSVTFARVVTVYQDQTAAATLAPLWAAALRGLPLQAGAGTLQREVTLPVSLPVSLQLGEPPPEAFDMLRDDRFAQLAAALQAQGVAVQQLRLDDTRDPAVTWLQIAGDGATQRWVGLQGGLQPPDFRSRLGWGLAALLGLVLITAWFVSRWVTRPLARLESQVDVIARGGVPAAPVRGAREVQRLGQALHDMAEQRARLDGDRRLMLLGISHDLRSPLARVRVAADLMNPADAPLREQVVRNVELADSIIGSFSDYVRADSAAGGEPAERVALQPLLAGCVAAAGLQAAVLQAPAETVWVQGQPLLLARAVSNLLDNALRHGRAPLRLTLVAEAGTGTATVTVEDSGAGIAEPERMLKPFERGDAARASPGSGLGLAVVARVAERHGSPVQIGRSSLGGAAVTLQLALSPQ